MGAKWAGKLYAPDAPWSLASVTAQLLLGVVTWDECLREKGAWDTLFWFAILVGLSDAISKAGLVAAASAVVRDALVQRASGRPALRGDARLADSDRTVAGDVSALAGRAPRRRGGARGGRRGRGRARGDGPGAARRR